MAAALSRPASVGTGLALVGFVGLTYGQFCPKVSDMRASRSYDAEATGSEKQARWTAAALVGLVSLVTRDVTVFVLGGGALVLFSWHHRYGNAYNPEIGTATLPASRQLVHAGDGMPAGYSPSA